MPDVLVAGGGPVGLLAGGLLARRGRSVVVLEKSTSPHGTPRAIATDDEVLRTLVALPGGADLLAGMITGAPVEFLDGAGRLLTRVDFGTSALRLPRLAFFDQPTLEVFLRGVLLGAGGELRSGCELLALTQDRAGVTATTRSNDVEQQLRAAYLLGTDGARSAVRRALGVGYAGRSGGQRWLVVDLDSDVPLPGPPRMRFRCDPAGPRLDLPRPGGHRVEALLEPGVTDAAATEPAFVQAAVERALPEHAALPGGRVSRAAVYEFQARSASAWRQGRVVLLGDAAHSMPPFGGQGLSAGLRDAAGLAWSLDLVLGGAGTGLLAAWERERRGHVAAMSRFSRLVGGVVQTRSPAAAAGRDRTVRLLDRLPGVSGWLRAGGPKPAPQLPRARRRLVAPVPPVAGCGLLLPRPLIDGQDLDDLLGDGHALLSWRLSWRVDPPDLDVLIGGRPRLVALPSAPTPLLRRLARELHLRSRRPVTGLVLLARPDRYLVGAVHPRDLEGLLAAYRRGWVADPAVPSR